MMRDYAGQSVVVVGGLGPLGAATVRQLADAGARVVVLDPATAPGANLARLAGYEQRIDIRLVDPAESGFPADLMRHAATVVHIPPRPASDDAWRMPTRSEDRMRLAALTLLDTARAENPSCRIVLASTRRVYGRPATLPVTDDTPLNPATLPAVQWLATEATYRAFAASHDLGVSILRFTTVYGRGADRPWAPLPDRFLARARAGEPIVAFADDTATDDYLYLDDAAVALAQAGRTPDARNRTFNIGSGQTHTPREVADLAVRVAGRGRVEVRGGGPPSHQSAPFALDAAPARRVLGLGAPVTLERGLALLAGTP